MCSTAKCSAILCRNSKARHPQSPISPSGLGHFSLRSKYPLSLLSDVLRWWRKSCWTQTWSVRASPRLVSVWLASIAVFQSCAAHAIGGGWWSLSWPYIFSRRVCDSSHGSPCYSANLRESKPRFRTKKCWELRIFR